MVWPQTAFGKGIEGINQLFFVNRTTHFSEKRQEKLSMGFFIHESLPTGFHLNPQPSEVDEI